MRHSLEEYSSARAAFYGGVREAWGTPALVLVAGIIGFGYLARETGWSIWLAVSTTGLLWALPGQVVLAEMWAVGASLIAITVAVSLTATRFLPMTLTLMPLMPNKKSNRLRFALSQFVSM